MTQIDPLPAPVACALDGPLTLASLCDTARWVAWKTVLRKGKPAKVPFNPATGSAASSTDSTTWGTRDAATRRCASMGADGVGIMLGTLDGITIGGLDLDSCIDPATGDTAEWATEALKRFNSYSEVSPSGEGDKVLFQYRPEDLAALPNLARIVFSRGEHCEMALDLHSRYYAVTGQTVVGYGDVLRPVALETLRWFAQTAGPAFKSAGDDKKRDRSSDAYAIACEVKRERLPREEFERRLQSDPVLAEWAEDARQVDRTWKRSTEPLTFDEDDEDPLAETPADDGLPLIDPASWQGIDVPERAWALQGWIPQGQATYLTGPGSAGKSLLSQQLATCIALGLPFLGMPTKQARALYLTCEDDSDELHRRQKAICTSLGVSVGDLSGTLFLASLVGDANTELCTFTDKGELRRTDRYSSIRKAAKSNGITFLALDNTAHLFSGNENARHDVASFVSLLNRLAMDIGGAVLFLGHPNKAGDSFSGSTAWENQVRSRLFMQTPTESDGSIVDRDVRILSRQKSNYARNGEQIGFRWHEWAFVSEADLPMTFSPAARAQIEDGLFIECLRKTASERRTVSPSASAANYAPRVFAKMACAGSIGIKGFESALHRLLDCDAIRNDQRIYQRDNRTWATGLGVAGGCTNPHKPAPGNGGIPAQSLHKADAQTRTDPAQSPHKPACTGPLYTTYISGEALEATPPDYPDAFDGGAGE